MIFKKCVSVFKHPLILKRFLYSIWPLVAPTKKIQTYINRSLILHENFNFQNDIYGHGSIRTAYQINKIYSASEQFLYATAVDKVKYFYYCLSVKLITIFVQLWCINIFKVINFIIQYIYLTYLYFPIFNYIFKFRAPNAWALRLK